jgi:replication-associated recombination protein RarA
MKKKVWNHLLYDIITKTIKKTSIPIFPDKTTIIKKIDPITNIYEKGSFRTNNNDIGNISSDYIGIFNYIVGYEDIKKLFIMAINANEPIHIMIIGPSASAKTIFMKCLMTLSNSYFVDGSNMTKSGMIDYLFNKNVKYLLIDEIDKIPLKDQTVFLNLMETGIVSETKYNKTRNMEAKISIFATCNDSSKIIHPIRSRFLSLILKAYVYEEFHKIVSHLLAKNKLDQKIIDGIIYAVWYKIKSKNIRDCIKIARMAKSLDDVIFLVNIYDKYSIKK